MFRIAIRTFVKESIFARIARLTNRKSYTAASNETSFEFDSLEMYACLPVCGCTWQPCLGMPSPLDLTCRPALNNTVPV